MASRLGRKVLSDVLMRSASLPLLFALWACQPSGLPDPGPARGSGHIQAEDLATRTPEKSPDFDVHLSLGTQTGAALASGLYLSASLVEFSVRSCASGYTMRGLNSAQGSLQLYRYDQSCEIWLESFALEGQIFTPMPGQPFNPSVGAESQFLGDAGRVVTVRVMEQLPHILDTPGAQVSFVIVERSLGRDFNVKVHAVGLGSMNTVLVESGASSTPVTVRRGVPAQGTLKVGLEVSGTALAGTDIIGIPAEVEFQDGVSEIILNVRAVLDDPFDDMETLQITIKSGPYFIVDPSLTFTVRDQSYRPPAWTQAVGSQSIQDDNVLSFSSAAADPDGDPVYYSIDTARTTCGNGWLTPLTINAAGLVTGVPGDAAIGTCLLALTAASLGGMIGRDITISVTDRPEAPVWTQLPPMLRIFEGETLDVTFRATDPDPGASVSYSLDSTSSCFGFAWNPQPTIGSSSGRLQGKPASATGGRCVITVRAQSQGDTITTDYQVEIARRTLVWNGPSGIPTSTCVAVTLLLSDGLDTYIEAPATATISLLVNNGSGTFSDRSSCSTTITSISWPAGTSQLTLYFRSTTANQNLTLVARGGAYESGFFNIAITAAASKLLVTGLSRPVVNQCVKYRVDQASSTNVKVIGTTARNVSLTLGTDQRAYSDAFCSSMITAIPIAANASGSDFYVLSSGTGSRTLRATATNLTAGQLAVQVVAARTWWNAAWDHRLAIQLDNMDQSVALSNQPVLIKLTAERFPYAQAKADGSDLRFVNSADSTLLPHQVEQWVPGGTSLIWVRVDQIPASSAQGMVYLYFGNAGALRAEQASTVWSEYAGVWHLNESPLASAPQFKDSTANARHGHAVSGLQSLQGAVGHSVSFMGSLDYIELTGFDLAPILGRTASFSAWVKTAQSGSTIGWSSPALTGVEHNGTTNDIQYGWLDNTGRIGVMAGDSGSAKSNFVVNDSTWRHVTITRNETGGAVTFFVNGVANGSGTSEAGFKSTPFNRFGILWDTSGAHQNFDGYMDEIRIYSGIMTANRIRADYKYMVDTHVRYLDVEDY